MPIQLVPLSTAGAILGVGVGVPKLHARFAGPAETFPALIDTGAVMTAISPAVRQAIRPQLLGVVPITRAGGVVAVVNTYDLRIRFDGHDGAGRWYSVEAAEAEPASPDVDILIGLDLLLRIRMTWDGRGKLLSITH